MLNWLRRWWNRPSLRERELYMFIAIGLNQRALDVAVMGHTEAARHIHKEAMEWAEKARA